MLSIHLILVHATPDVVHPPHSWSSFCPSTSHFHLHRLLFPSSILRMCLYQCRQLASTRRPEADNFADKFVELLVRRSDNLTGGWSWWKEIMGCGGSTKNIGCPIMCLSSNIDLLIRRRSTFSCCSRHCHSGHHDIGITTYRTTTTVRCRYRHLTSQRDTNRALDNGAVTLVYETITSLKHVVIE